MLIFAAYRSLSFWVMQQLEPIASNKQFEHSSWSCNNCGSRSSSMQAYFYHSMPSLMYCRLLLWREYVLVRSAVNSDICTFAWVLFYMFSYAATGSTVTVEPLRPLQAHLCRKETILLTRDPCRFTVICVVPHKAKTSRLHFKRISRPKQFRT